MNSVSRIGDYKFSQDDKLLLDANIWLYLFAPPSKPSGYATKVYSEAFKRILSAKSQVVLSSTILSEYLNRYCRIEWGARFKEVHPDFKSFRQSQDYFQVGNGAATYARAMLKQSRRVDDGFAGTDIAAVLGDFESGRSDFNDGLLVSACASNSWKLVTHDGDFKEGGIHVLTDNAKLITACGKKE